MYEKVFRITVDRRRRKCIGKLEDGLGPTCIPSATQRPAMTLTFDL